MRFHSWRRPLGAGLACLGTTLAIAQGQRLPGQEAPAGQPPAGADSARGCRNAPEAPTGLRSPAQTGTTITLEWNAVASRRRCHVTYTVYDRATPVATGLTRPGVTLTGLTPGAGYLLSVTATNEAGRSAPSVGLAVKTPSGTPCAAAPDVPAGLASTGQTSSSVSLAWKGVSAPAGCSVTYNVYRNGSLALTVPTTTAIVSGLAADTSYAFSLAAADAAGTSPQSAPLTVKTSPGTTPPPPPGPTPTPAGVLAAVTARMTSVNQVNTQPHLNTMNHSQAVNVYQVAPGIFAFSSGMAIDTDGSDPDPDPDHQGQTTWETSDGQSLGAHHVPYYVLGDICYDGGKPCKWFYYAERNVKALQFALVFYGGKAIGAVFGDTQGPPGGDARELGEASVQTATLLGIPNSGTTGGVEKGVTYVVFSGPAWVLGGTNSTLNASAQALVSRALSTLAQGMGVQGD